MSRLYVDEFCVPPYSMRSQPMLKIGPPKTAWGEKLYKSDLKRSFHPQFTRFATLFKLIGFFPVTFQKSGVDMTFSWTSTVTMVSMCVLPMTQLAALATYPTDDILFQFTSYVSILIPIISKTLFIMKLPAFIKLIKLMDSIDTNSCLKVGDPKITQKNHLFVILLWLVSLAVNTFPYSMSFDGVTPITFNVTISQIHTVSTKLSLMCFCYVVCYQLRYLYDRYHASLNDLAELPCAEMSEQILEDHRVTHAQLVSCVRLMDDTFGFWLAFVYVDCSMVFLQDCYNIIYSSAAFHYSLYGTFKRICALFFVFYPAVLLDGILGKNKDTIHYTFKMALKPYDDNVIFQVYYFMRQVTINKAAVSAAGLADVNKEIITSGLALFATFYVATIQMEPQMKVLLDGLRDVLDTMTK